ncbi:MAG: hypothetical protein VKJ87_01085 [Synechococcus sp.]|nr:hypothetical protein [Synechococcus sp.]
MAAGPQCDRLSLQRLGVQHLPLLNQPWLEPLRPLLQQLLLQQGPQQLRRLLNRQQAAPPLALIGRNSSGGIEAVLTAEAVNRSGSAWRITNLVLSDHTSNHTHTSAQLVRQVLELVPTAVSWLARVHSDHNGVLCGLRDQGFQTLQHLRCWRFNSLDGLQSCDSLSSQFELQPLERSNAALLLQLELSVTPSHLRQMQDLRSDDLLADAQGGSLLLLDRARHQAVAAARLVRRRGPGPCEVELSLHPAWRQLQGPPLAHLLARSGAGRTPLRLRCDLRNSSGQEWLAQQGAEAEHEELVLARSLWRRQELPGLSSLANRTLERLVGQLQPGQQPVPEAIQWR